jgi:hypothetical protein
MDKLTPLGQIVVLSLVAFGLWLVFVLTEGRGLP